MAKDWPGQKWPESLDELVQGWLAYRRDTSGGADNPNLWVVDSLHDLTQEHPEWAWKFVLAALDALAGTSDHLALAVLAAGPLEDLLACHGPAFINRVETEARRSPDFRQLLGGVWQNSMSDDIWQRVLKAAPNRW